MAASVCPNKIEMVRSTRASTLIMAVGFVSISVRSSHSGKWFSGAKCIQMSPCSTRLGHNDDHDDLRWPSPSSIYFHK